MKKIIILVIATTAFLYSYSQDLIIKRNGEEIKTKVLEVALTIVKYKNYSNPNGPTYEILKSEIFMIKYENGTKDVINPIQQKNEVIDERKNESADTKSANLAFTENHKSTTIGYGLSALFGGITNFGVTGKTFAIGPVMMSFDKALSKNFSLGFRPAVMLFNYQYPSVYGNTTKSTLFFGGMQVRCDYHFGTTSKIDPYFGLAAGIGYFVGDKDFGGISGVNPLYGGGFGIKLYGNSMGALLLELGFDSYSYLKVGYTFAKKK